MLQEYKAILKKENLTGKQMAEKLGLSYDSYRSMTKDTVEVVPKWVVSFVLGYKLNADL